MDNFWNGHMLKFYILHMICVMERFEISIDRNYNNGSKCWFSRFFKLWYRSYHMSYDYITYDINHIRSLWHESYHGTYMVYHQGLYHMIHLIWTIWLLECRVRIDSFGLNLYLVLAISFWLNQNQVWNINNYKALS